jgi:hypothetical protein
MSTPEFGLSSLTSALTRFGRFRKRWAVLDGMSRFVLLGPGLLFGWLLLDAAVEFPSWLLLALFVAIGAAGLFAAAWWLLPALLRKLDPEREALVIEALRGGLDNLLIGALQLGREVAAAAGRRLSYSSVLVERLVARAAEELRLHDPARLLNLKRTRRMLAAALAVVVANAVLLVSAPDLVGQRFLRLHESWMVLLDTLFPVQLDVEPGDTAVLRGAPVTLRVHARGAHRKDIRLTLKGVDGGLETNVVLRLEKARSAHTIPKVEESFRYQFACGKRRSAPKTVWVGDRPEITAITHELMYPPYTGQPLRTLMGRTAKLQALKGTTVMISFACSVNLHPDLSCVEWREGGRQAISVNGRFGHFSFVVREPNLAVLRLTGQYGRGFEMADPPSIQIVAEDDQAPSVAVLLRKDKLILYAEEAAGLILPYSAEDDFGVTEVMLNYRIDTIDAMLGRAPREGALSRLVEPAAERANGKFTTIFSGLDPALQPGDRVRIELAAKDNNVETGPGLGRSRTIELVIVQPDLAQYAEKGSKWIQAEALLGGLKRVGRASNLLAEPERSVRTEKALALEKQALEARLNAETWPSGAEDAVADYFKLLSGGK